MRIVQLAQVVPDGGVLWNDVRLIPSVGDHVVGALGESQVLAPEIPGDIHQLDGVECAAAPPGCAGRMRRLSLEGVLQRD